MLSHWLNWDVKLSDSVVFRLLQPLVPTQVTVSLVEIALKIIIPFEFLASHC